MPGGLVGGTVGLVGVGLGLVGGTAGLAGVVGFGGSVSVVELSAREVSRGGSVSSVSAMAPRAVSVCTHVVSLTRHVVSRDIRCCPTSVVSLRSVVS